MTTLASLINKISNEINSKVQSFENESISLRKASEENNENVLFIIKDIYLQFQKNNLNFSDLYTNVKSNRDNTYNAAKDVINLQSLFNYNYNFLLDIHRRVNNLEITSSTILNNNVQINNFVKNVLFKQLDYNVQKFGTMLSLGLTSPNSAKKIGYNVLGTAIAGAAGTIAYNNIISSESYKAGGAEQPYTGGPSDGRPSGGGPSGGPAVDDRTSHGNKNPNEPSGSDVEKTYHPYNVERRKHLYDEIKNTPGLKEWVSGVISKEGDPTAVLESIVNRALMNKKNIAEITNFNYSGNWNKSFFL